MYLNYLLLSSLNTVFGYVLSAVASIIPLGHPLNFFRPMSMKLGFRVDVH